MARAARAIASELRTEDAWEGFLALELRRPVRVRFTRARKTPVQVRPVALPHGALEVRLHGLFAGAPPEVHAALASWIRSGRRAPRACERLDAWIAASMKELPPAAARHAVVARGAHHDLEGLAREVLAGELAAEFAALGAAPPVTWGRRGLSRTRRSLRLGSYDPDSALVRIHPVLDQPGVPAWFVRFVVFHELLHVVFPPRRGAGDRWIHHGREFRARERRHADFRRALEWERRNLTALIRSARRGTAFVAAEETPRPARGRAAAATRPAPVQPRGVLRVLQGWLFPGD